MKKFLYWFLLPALCLPLAGCAGGQTGSIGTPSGKGEEQAPAAGQVSARPEGEEPQIQESWVLYEKDGVTAELLEGLDPDTGELTDYLRLTAPKAENRSVMLTDLTINGRYTTGEIYLNWEEGRPELWKLKLGALRARDLLPDTDRVFTCHIQEEEWFDNWTRSELLWEGEGEAVIPADFSPEILLTGEGGIFARRQRLLERDGLSVTLEKLGTPPKGSYQEDLYGLLKVENRSSAALPFRINGISLNGAYFSLSGDAYYLEPGTDCYPLFRLSASALEESGVGQVSEASLLLLTREKENSGFFSAAGGSWYPVRLEGESTAAEGPDIEELMTGNDYVQIGFLGTGEEASFGEEDKYCYHWYLLVRNLSEENLELTVTAPEGEGVTWWITDGEIGAGTWRYMTLNALTGRDDPRPKTVITFRGLTPGGGGIVFEKSNPVDLSHYVRTY